MKHTRLWLVAALGVAAILLLSTVFLGARAPAALAQAATGTARPGIRTLLTPSPEPSTAPASPTPVPTSRIVIPLAGTAVTNTTAMTNTIAMTGTGTLAGPFPGTITVVGEGRVSVKPDVARVNIGVETVKPTVKEASTETRTTMEKVLAAVKAAGVADKDIQTSNFNIFVERTRPPEGQPGTEEVRYHVSNNASITIRNLDTVGDVLDAAIEAGANNVYGVTFAVEDQARAEAQAREEAVADAQRRAGELARLNGVRVGRVLIVSEVIGNQAGPIAANFREAAGQGGGGGGPVSPGELELLMQLQITYSMQ